MELVLAGDIIFGKGVSTLARAHGLEYFFRRVAPLFHSADWVVANMEGCITHRGEPMEKEYTFRAPPELALVLRWANIPMVSLGNNHSMDYGAVALEDTLDHLWRAGVWWAGAGRNRAQASQAVYLDMGAIRVALVCFSAVVPRGFPAGTHTPGVATWGDVLPTLQEARQNADVLVAIPHWGEEGKTTPNAKQRRIASALAEAGVHLCVGHHPHVVQGYERVGAMHTVYSVGNFVHTPISARARRALMVRARLTKVGIERLEGIPLWLEAGQPRPKGALIRWVG